MDKTYNAKGFNLWDTDDETSENIMPKQRDMKKERDDAIQMLLQAKASCTRDAQLLNLMLMPV